MLFKFTKILALIRQHPCSAFWDCPSDFEWTMLVFKYRLWEGHKFIVVMLCWFSRNKNVAMAMAINITTNHYYSLLWSAIPTIQATWKDFSSCILTMVYMSTPGWSVISFRADFLWIVLSTLTWARLGVFCIGVASDMRLMKRGTQLFHPNWKEKLAEKWMKKKS